MKIEIPFRNLKPGIVKIGQDNTMRACIAICIIIGNREFAGATPTKMVAGMNKCFA